MLSLSRPLAIALLVGTVLLGAGAALHPILPPDPAAQLRLIAATWYFRPIHLAMLAGSALIILGVWCRALLARESISVPMIAALALICLGICFNAIDIAFMAGAGTRMAELFQTGRTEMSALFDSLHMLGLMTARFGNLLIALGTLLVGWIERQDPESPAWVAWLAWIAGVGGLIGAVFFPEASLAILTAVTLLSGWTVATSWRVLRGAAEHAV